MKDETVAVNQAPKATFYGPLDIGNTTIDAYVIETDAGPVRILSTRGVMKSLGRRWRGRKYTGTELPVFLEANNLKPFIHSDLAAVLKPVEFRTPRGALAEGYNAEALPRVCDVFLDAREAKALKPSQYATAKQCEILVRGLATVGIIALVDEATGYQEIRDHKALQAILEKYLLPQYAKWAKRFPDEFYSEMFRLRGWQWKGMQVNRPSVVGRFTNNIVYMRLAPGVLEELRVRNPPDEKGRRRSKFHQWLTPDVGHLALSQHLHAVIAIMRGSTTWDQFMRFLSRSLPPQKGQTELPLGDGSTEGKTN